MAKATAHRPSQASQQYVKNSKGEKVLNTAYKAGSKGKSKPGKSSAQDVMKGFDKELDSKTRYRRIAENGELRYEYSDGTVSHLTSDDEFHAINAPAHYSPEGIGFYRNGVKNSTGAPDVDKYGARFYMDGHEVTQDDIVENTGRAAILETAINTGDASDKNGFEYSEVSFRGSMISLLAKDSGKSVEDTEKDSGHILDKLLATKASRKSIAEGYNS